MSEKKEKKKQTFVENLSKIGLQNWSITVSGTGIKNQIQNNWEERGR